MENRMYVFSMEDGMSPRGEKRIITLKPLNCVPYQLFEDLKFMIGKEDFLNYEMGSVHTIAIKRERE